MKKLTKEQYAAREQSHVDVLVSLKAWIAQGMGHDESECNQGDRCLYLAVKGLLSGKPTQYQMEAGAITLAGGLLPNEVIVPLLILTAPEREPEEGKGGGGSVH